MKASSDFENAKEIHPFDLNFRRVTRNMKGCLHSLPATGDIQK
jgi:hypothetical protein